jgi:hypothetical protein
MRSWLKKITTYITPQSVLILRPPPVLCTDVIELRFVGVGHSALVTVHGTIEGRAVAVKPVVEVDDLDGRPITYACRA